MLANYIDTLLYGIRIRYMIELMLHDINAIGVVLSCHNLPGSDYLVQ